MQAGAASSTPLRSRQALEDTRSLGRRHRRLEGSTGAWRMWVEWREGGADGTMGRAYSTAILEVGQGRSGGGRSNLMYGGKSESWRVERAWGGRS